MKKTVFSILTLLVLASCGNNATQKSLSGDTDSTSVECIDSVCCSDSPCTIVAAAYENYFNPSDDDLATAEESDMTFLGLGYMYKYMDPSLVDKLMEARDKQNETDDLFFDYDIWTNAQDDDKWELKKVETIFKGEDSATVEVTIKGKELGEWKTMVATIYDEENGWMISDFIQPECGTSLLEDIEHYLEIDPDAGEE